MEKKKKQPKKKNRLLQTITKNRKALLKSSVLILILASVVGLAYLTLRMCGLTDMAMLRETLGNTIWLYLAIGLLQAFQVIFIPLSNQIITVPACLMFKDHLPRVFLASWAGIELGTMILYTIGRYGGKRIIAWVLSDKEKAERCSDWLNKGRWIYPIGMVIGFIPDDILTTLAGVGKYNFWYVLGISILTRGICVACSVWGFGYLTGYWWGWVIIAVAVVAIGLATFCLYRANSYKEVNVSFMK